MKQSRVKTINIVFLATVLLSIASGPIVQVVKDISNNEALAIIVSQLILILPAIVYICVFRMNLKESIRFKGIAPGNVIMLILISYLIVPALSIINAFSMIFADNVIQGTVTELTNKNPIWISLITAALIPCILEESVYRGVLFNGYRKTNVLKGIFLSGLLFGLMHMNINQFMYAATMGVIFALLIEATDSILASMIVHFMINGSSIVYSYALPKLYKYLGELSGQDTSKIDIMEEVANYAPKDLLKAMGTLIIPAVVCTILAVLVFRAIAQNAGRWEHIKDIFKINKKEESKFMTIPLAVGISICIAIMLITQFVKIK